MRVHIVDPSSFTRPYDHGLCAALARAGADVELITCPFPYGTAPPPDGYVLREEFYRHARGAPGSRLRRLTKLAEHVPDMLGYRRSADAADVVHFQWLDVQWFDRYLLPDRPLVLTAHDLLPREPRPGQVRAQRRLYDLADALVVHSEYGRRRLVEMRGLDPRKLHVVHHGAFEHLTRLPGEQPLGAELQQVSGPVALFFGLMRPYKGLDVLLEAWRGVSGAELWIVGRPLIDVKALRTLAPPGVRFVTRFVSDAELPAYFRRADVVVLPYSRTERFDQSGVLAISLAFAKPTIVTDVGGFSELAGTGAAALVPAGDPLALRETLTRVLDDGAERERLARGAAAAAAGPYSWGEAARRTLVLYRDLLRTQGVVPAPQSTPR
jgi:glycosyltransferase involved in cell wall biosynthesis